MQTWINKIDKKISFLLDNEYAISIRNKKNFHTFSSPKVAGLFLIKNLISFARLTIENQPFQKSDETPKTSSTSLLRFQKNILNDFDSDHRTQESGLSALEKSSVGIILIAETCSLSALERSILLVDRNLIVTLLLISPPSDELIKIKKAFDSLSILVLSSAKELIPSINKLLKGLNKEYVAIQSAETVLRDGSIEILMNTMKSNTSCFSITGKVTSSNELLLEAGTYIDNTGMIQPYGSFQLPYKPKYQFIRETDSLSDYFTFFRKKTFDKLEGLDEKFQSLTYALTDLAQKAKKSANQNIYHPFIELVKLTACKDNKYPQSDVEKLKENNPEIYHGDTSEDDSARKLLPEKKILFIDILLPAYDQDSGSLRAYHLLKILKQLGYHIIFMPRKGEIFEPYYSEFVQLGIEILYAFPDRQGMESELKRLLPEIDIAWICRPQLNKEFEWIFTINPNIKWIYDTIDLHYIRLRREAILHKSIKLKRKAEKFHRLELAIAKKADVTFTVTEDESQLLQDQGIKHTSVVPNIHDSLNSEEGPNFHSRRGLLFIGSYDHPPNIDAVVWLVEEIMPLVWQHEKIPLTLLGSKPTEKVKSLASELVTVTGFVQDVSPYFLENRLFVAPLRYGAGMKGKIGQSLSYQLPIITTHVGAEGIGLQDGKNVLIAETKEQFAVKILQAYNDEVTWNQLVENSGKVLEPFRPENVMIKLKAVIEAI